MAAERRPTASARKAAKAQIETHLLDAQTGQVLVVPADRREAAFGIFGGVP